MYPIRQPYSQPVPYQQSLNRPQVHSGQRPSHVGAANPMQHIAGALMHMIKEVGHKVTEPFYSLAKDNPAMYALGAATASMTGGAMSCPYCGIAIAMMGAAGYMNANMQWIKSN